MYFAWEQALAVIGGSDCVSHPLENLRTFAGDEDIPNEAINSLFFCICASWSADISTLSALAFYVRNAHVVPRSCSLSMLFTLDRRHQRAMDSPVVALKNRACAELLLSVSLRMSVSLRQSSSAETSPDFVTKFLTGVVAEVTHAFLD